MHDILHTPASFSLAAIRPGEQVEIEHILSESLRVHCDALDFRVGDTVCCRTSGRAAVLLETPRGRLVSVDMDRARFVRVSSRTAMDG